jgi:hypothetical protein
MRVREEAAVSNAGPMLRQTGSGSWQTSFESERFEEFDRYVGAGRESWWRGQTKQATVGLRLDALFRKDGPERDSVHLRTTAAYRT